MLPKVLTAMLMGRSSERQPRSRPLPVWMTPKGARHPAEGQFEVEAPPEPGPAPVVIEVVDADVARAMADEAKRLSRQTPTS